jgi:hypothetical protein
MRTRTACLLLAACAAPPVLQVEEVLLTDPHLPPPRQTLTLDAPAGLPVGYTQRVEVTGGLSIGEVVYLVRARTAAGGSCPGVLGGACLALDAPLTLIASTRVEAPGGASLWFEVPATMPVGSAIGLQAVVVRGLGGTSSVVSNPARARTVAAVPGCTHPLADNHDPVATVDDGSCSWPGWVDVDGDGWPGADDCDDADPSVNPEDGGCEMPCQDTSPQLTVTLEPAQPRVNDAIEAVVTLGPTCYPPGLSYRWQIDGVEQVGQTGPSLPAGTHARAEEVSVQVTAHASGWLVEADAHVQIANTPPTLGACVVSPGPVGVADALTVAPTGAVDADGDPVEVRVQWEQVFGPVWVGLPGETSTTLASCADRYVPGAWFHCDPGDRLRATCTPFDGEEEGEMVSSAVVEVR